MRLVTLLSAALVLGPAAPSFAESEPIPVTGGCDVAAAASDPGDPARVTGIVYGYIAVADVRGQGAATPASVTLTCSVQSASYAHASPDDFTAVGSGTNAAAVAPQAFSVPAPPDGYALGLCARVDVTDADGTRTYWAHGQNGMWYSDFQGTCSGAPQCLAYGSNCVWYLAFAEWLADRGDVNPDLKPVWDAVDPTVCAALVAHAPGTDPVEIRGDGDVYVAGELLWDCPPYEE
ncbi:MAG TPA: hypothetical protein VNA20_16160 [Frankiaceae bacterium]|nr:hypothetical protein [Frankiaceae bacterium]